MFTSIEITFDFICPWCWIGHQNVKVALATTGLSDAVELRYLPFELNKDMPAQGTPSHVDRSSKLGNWARSQSMEEDVTQAGKLVGLQFNYSRIKHTPNTRLAHMLMAYAQSFGDHAKSSRIYEAIFHAYFSLGKNIGDQQVLSDIVSQHGLDAEHVKAFMNSESGSALVEAAINKSISDGVTSVPNLLVGSHTVSGAQSAESLASIFSQL